MPEAPVARDRQNKVSCDVSHMQTLCQAKPSGLTVDAAVTIHVGLGQAENTRRGQHHSLT